LTTTSIGSKGSAASRGEAPAEPGYSGAAVGTTLVQTDLAGGRLRSHMALSIQIVYDCVDPQRLSEFYAAALHYKLQDPPEGFPTWEAFLASIGVPKEEWNDGSAVVDPEGKGPRIYFQKMNTRKPKKNRLHLDLDASGGRKTPEKERRRRIDADVERILALGMGAKKFSVSDDPNWYFVTMLDPEGNEFDVH